MQIIRKRSTAGRVFAMIINITAVLGYVTLVAVWIWWNWYTGGPK